MIPALTRLCVYAYALGALPYAALVKAWRRWFGCPFAVRIAPFLDGEDPNPEEMRRHFGECDLCARDLGDAMQLSMAVKSTKDGDSE